MHESKYLQNYKSLLKETELRSSILSEFPPINSELDIWFTIY